MSTQYGEFIRLTTLRLGRGDGTARLAIENSINEAILITALLFDVPELVTTKTISPAANEKKVDLTTTDLIFDIIKIRNITASIDMGFVPLHLLDVIVPSGLDLPKYWSRQGNTIQFRGPAGTGQTFEAIVKTFLAPLVNDTDTCPYDGHDPEILAIATTLAASSLDEKEKLEQWKAILAELHVPYFRVEAEQARIQGLRTGTKETEVAPQGQKGYDNYIQ